jgi:hypothetical protein
MTNILENPLQIDDASVKKKFQQQMKLKQQ